MVFQQLAAESLAPTACTTIEEVGSTGVGALTIAFLILAVSTVVFIARTGSATTQKKNYYCNVFICGFATMAYFAMLSGQGWTAVAGCRQFFYARYVDMGVTFPLVLLNLGLIAGCEGALIAAVIGAQMISTFSAYLGAVSVVTTVKWFWFVISISVFTMVSAQVPTTDRQQWQPAGSLVSIRDRSSCSSIPYPLSSRLMHQSSIPLPARLDFCLCSSLACGGWFRPAEKPATCSHRGGSKEQEKMS
mmetsp:Transcript_40027/g.62473  ORF Transcript_40027/g.62473 Transcript_40027/m.62473 type:complete len:247 (-) Transcript_40027:505-1245(-)